jgi:hypothetical protein
VSDKTFILDDFPISPGGEQFLSRSPRLREILDRSRKNVAEKGAVPWNAFWQGVEEGQGAEMAVHEKRAQYKVGKQEARSQEETPHARLQNLHPRRFTLQRA